MRKTLFLILLISTCASAELEGHVFDSNGTALDDIAIEAYRGGMQIAVAYTDLEGFYSLELAPGNYEIRVLGGMEEKSIDYSGGMHILDFEIELVKNYPEEKTQTFTYLALVGLILLAAGIYWLRSQRKEDPGEIKDRSLSLETGDDELTVLRSEKKRIDAMKLKIRQEYGAGELGKDTYESMASDYDETLDELKEKIAELEKNIKV